METKHKIQEKLITLAKENKKPINSVFNFFIPTAKIAIIMFRQIASEEGLLWDDGSKLTKDGKKYNIYIKIPSFYANKTYTQEERKKIKKYKKLKEIIKFIAKYHKVHFQIKIALIKNGETMVWNDKCPSNDELSELDIMNISTIGFSKKPSEIQQARYKKTNNKASL